MIRNDSACCPLSIRYGALPFHQPDLEPLPVLRGDADRSFPGTLFIACLMSLSTSTTSTISRSTEFPLNLVSREPLGTFPLARIDPHERQKFSIFCDCNQCGQCTKSCAI